MELRFTPTDEDLLNIMRVSSRWGWNTVQFLLSFVPIFFFGAAMVSANMPVEGWVCIALSLVIACAGYEIPRFQWRKLGGNTPAAKRERIVTVADDGVTTTLPLATAQYQWGAFMRYRETEALFVLFSSSRQIGTWIPKRAMSPDQISTLRNLLKARVPNPESSTTNSPL